MIYAIGDIHGHLEKLREAHALIEADKAKVGAVDAPIVHVGDLIDRGPNSAGVIDYLMQGTDEGRPWVNLMGNHDRLMFWFLDDHRRADPRLRSDYNWLHERMGGRETLESYGVGWHSDLTALQAEAQRAVPDQHILFLKRLKLTYAVEDVFFTHAGIRPGIPLDQQAEDDLLWIRREFHDDPRDHGALIVHGHTPVDTVEHHGNRLNIDTGAAWGRDLSTVVIDAGEVFLLTNEGREPVVALA